MTREQNDAINALLKGIKILVDELIAWQVR